MTSAPFAALDSIVAVRAGWVMVLAVWATSGVAVCLAAWRMLRPQASSAAQHRAAAVALTLCLIVLLAIPTLALHRGRQSRPDGAATSQTQVSFLNQTGLGRTLRVADSVALIASSASVNRVMGGVGILWLIGVIAMLARLVGGWVLTERVRRRAEPVEEDAVQQVLRRVQRHFGLDHVVRLGRSTEIDAPVVIGARHATLLLPSDLAAQMPTEALPPLLAHECAHIVRHDYAANIAQCVADAFLFFSPAAYWVSFRLREAREFCCDDAAVQFCAEDRAQYVRVLTTLASFGSQLRGRSVLGSAGPRLITRVRRLLSEDAMPRPSVLRVAAALLTITLVGGVGPLVLRVSATHLAASAATGGLAAADWPLPYGYATRQPGSSVTLRVDRGEEYLADTITLRNVADVAVTSVTLAAIVETEPMLHIATIVTSDPIAVSVAPASTRSIPAHFLSRADVSSLRITKPARQVFFGLRRVLFANGAEWSIQPNAAARNHDEALGIPPYSIPRTLVSRAAGTDTSKNVCLDDAGDMTSQGGVVPVRDEPGREVQCVNGRWVDYGAQTKDDPSGADHGALRLRLELVKNGSVVAKPEISVDSGSEGSINADAIGSIHFTPTLRGSDSLRITFVIDSAGKRFTPSLVLSDEPGSISWSGNNGDLFVLRIAWSH